MKKNVSCFLFLLLVVWSYAFTVKQKDSDSKIKFGLEGGLNLSKLEYTNKAHYNLMTNFILAYRVGAYANIHLSDKFDFMPELIYSVKGFRNYAGNDIVTVDGSNYFKAHYGYIEIPLQIKYNLNKHFALMAGPYLGVFTRVSTNYSFNYLSHNPKENNFNIIDIGVVFGIGYQIANGFNFALKYSQGLRNVPAHYSSPSNVAPIHVYNMVFSLCVGWTIGKLHK